MKYLQSILLVILTYCIPNDGRLYDQNKNVRETHILNAARMHVYCMCSIAQMLYRFYNLIQETFLFRILHRITAKWYACFRKLKVGWHLAIMLLQQWHLSRYKSFYFRRTILSITPLKSFLLILSHTLKQLLSRRSILYLLLFTIYCLEFCLI